MPRDATNAELESLLEYLRRSRGFDFAAYKRSTLQRRIAKRMQAVQATTFTEYRDFLEVHPEEFGPLFDAVLINVTGFFRDEETWHVMRDKIIPDLIERRGPIGMIRVWSAGCASGAEPYSLAMLFSELLGAEEFRSRVKIYATDVDADALAQARQASYTARQIEGVPEELVSKYVDLLDDRYTIRKDLRRQIIFGRHDLIQDAPISRVDLLTCRNTLMYFNAEVQARILARFRFALNEGGILFLGRAETLLTRGDAFTPVDLKRRISMKTSSVPIREHLLASPYGGAPEAYRLERMRDVLERAFDASPVAQLVVDRRGIVVHVNDRARALFGLTAADVGRPVQDSTISYRPTELRPHLEEATAERRATVIPSVPWQRSGQETRTLDVHIVPLASGRAELAGASVTFVDVTEAERLQHDLELAHQQLETAYAELQSTNEELETTNEELQSINKEVRTRGDELNQVNGLLEAILRSFPGGVVVADRDLRVLLWNHKAEDLWGIRREEVLGKRFFNLDIGLPVEQLHAPARHALSGTNRVANVTIRAINRRGRAINVQVRFLPLLTPEHDVTGVIMLMDDETLPRRPGGDARDGDARDGDARDGDAPGGHAPEGDGRTGSAARSGGTISA